jgi:aspartyl-tRNA(Asn)/glutamyl-tRNA(Gln) amidotransferase subunit A
MYLADIYTLPASLAGIPAISVPSLPTKPTTNRPALPVGLKIMAAPLDEERMFAVAAAFETASPARAMRLPPNA